MLFNLSQQTRIRICTALLLQLTGLGIVPFFVENVSVLQLSALRLVRAVSYSLHLVLFTALQIYIYI